MPELDPIIIVGGCLFCAALGAWASAIWYRAKLDRIHNETWNSARIFYSNKQRESRL